MLTLREHDVTDYEALRDMDGTDVSTLLDDDHACLDELGQYLVATDSWQRFAIWLLHKHFLPDPGELFIESVNVEDRTTQTSPVARSERSALELQATAMRFDSAVDSGVSLIGMEFAAPDDFGATTPLSANDESVLSGIADRLRSHGKTERFGVRLIRNTVSLTDDELFLETSDGPTRTLTNRVADRAANRDQNIETAWQWAPVMGDDGPIVMQKCYFECEPWTDGEHTRTGC
jgi:hypothetical protein